MLRMSHHIRSRWMNGGSPTTCANTECNATFEGAAFRGKTDKYYCSRSCRAEVSDEPTLEEIARRHN